MPLLVYTLLRMALLVAALAALWAVGMRGWLWVLVATVVAFAVAYAALPGRRDAAARWLAERAQERRRSGMRFGAGAQTDEAAEDDEVDQIARPRPSSTP